MKQRVETWLSICGQHKHETRGFTLDLKKLTDDDLVTLKQVSAEFLEIAPLMFGVIHPKQHPELRKSIAYLHHLSSLQNAAWERLWERVNQDAAEIEQLMTITQHGR
jgi:hypothetical protein